MFSLPITKQNCFNLIQNEDKKMRSLAVVPPVQLDARERRLRFENRNGLVEDPMTDFRERSLLNVWSEQVRNTICATL